MDIPQTHYARTADGLDIAYQVIGDGPRDLVWCGGFTSNIEAMWHVPEMATTFRRLARFCRVIVFDRRGCGVSDRVPETAPPLEVGVEDVRAVMEAAGSPHASLFGFVDGSPLSVLVAAAEPALVERLILWNPEDVRGLGIETPGAETWTWQQAEEWINWHETAWGTPEFMREWLTMFVPSVRDDAAASDRWLRFHRQAGTPRSIAAMQRMLMDIDVIPVLGSVQAPTLVLHRSAEGEMYQLASSEFVAARIQDARLIVLPGHDVFPYVRSELVVDEIAQFLTGARPQRDIDRVLATVLFTDIVDSTVRVAELGDARWKELLASHDEVARDLIELHRGRYINTTGDGLLATFDGPARAVRCARDIGDAVGELGIQIRAGCHTGEIELDGHDIRGVAVHIGARVASVAGAGEVLVSSTVKDLVAGSGLVFEDAGDHELKGVPDRWHLYRIGAGSN